MPEMKARLLTYFEKNAALGLAFSPDSKTLVSAGGNEFKPERTGGKTSAQVKLWDVTAGKELGELTGHTNKVFSAAFAPDGQTLATGSADQTVRLWDVATRKPRAVLEGHADAVWSVAFSADGKIVVTASADRTVKLWDTSTGKERATLRGHRSGISAVAFSQDDRTLASAGIDDAVRLGRDGIFTIF